MKTPAQQLAGMTLDGGWKVVSPAPVALGQTGGNFSEGYVVQGPNGQKAFLKALDYSRAMEAPDPALALKPLIDSFIFERDLLAKCRARGLDRIVTAIGDGTVSVAGQRVQYLIFELADGDLRALASASKRFELAWMLRALHHVATGLLQLHGEEIAHQDVKPSNVLVFGGVESKLADLGRAAYKGHFAPHEDREIAGDPTYAPPELLYRYVDPNWNPRRLGCDAYLLGSMVVFFFTGASVTPLLRKELHDAHAWGKGNWSGTYEEVLPYVRDGFGRVLETFKQTVDPEVRAELVTTVSELCEPDPRLRGHPLNRVGKGNQYSVERYVSQFNLLARKAELRLLGKR